MQRAGYERPTKPCKTCGEPFEKNPRYSAGQWARARYCSRRCQNTYHGPICACGCGQRVQWYRGTYCQGHNPNSSAQRVWMFNHSANRWYVLDRNGKRVLWYRIVMENELGRPLAAGEVVHHIDGDSANDAPENLRVFSTNGAHLRATLSHHRGEWACST